MWRHTFQDESENPKYCTWYVGTVIDYRVSDKTHCIAYDGEDGVCYFNLPIDFVNGDVILYINKYNTDNETQYYTVFRSQRIHHVQSA